LDAAAWTITEMANEAERILVEYLETCSTSTKDWPRVRCTICNASRYFYCPDCCKILLPREIWPQPLRDGSFRVPFKVDFILDDRRTSSTGIQAATIIDTASFADESRPYRIIDREADEIANYEEEADGTYLLFPGPTSVPLSTLLSTSQVKTLVVLDCKWSRSSVRLHPSVAFLPKVHLDGSPKQSFYWRWHNAGEGMLSTVEAIYYAAWTVAESQKWAIDERKQLVLLLWFFGLQREVIRRKYEKNAGLTLPPHLPFTEDGKEYRRAMRRRPTMKEHK